MRELVSLDVHAEKKIRKNLEIDNGPLRISFCGGPGDVVGTYHYWKNGLPDPRVPSITYSSQLFELSTRLNASLQVISPFKEPSKIDHDIRFDQVIKNPFNGRVEYFKMQRKYVNSVLNKVNDFDPHVMIISTDFPHVGWKKLKLDRKLVLTAHNTFWPMGLELSGLKGRIKKSLLRQRIKHLDGAVCTSHECARQIEMVSHGHVESYVEHPQIASTFEVQNRKSAQNLLYLGRIEESKGIYILLEAYRSIKPNFPELSLSFAGSGSESEKLHYSISQAGTADVQFVGSLDSNGVHEAIARSDLLVCPTTSGFNEGLALVGFEAAAHGIPSILSSVVPARDLLEDCAIIFQADSIADLSIKLENLITDSELYCKLAMNTSRVRMNLYNAESSWGSQLANVLQNI